ncbi:hypothetical protein AKJ16_DCAP04871 [Drosera capensis]
MAGQKPLRANFKSQAHSSSPSYLSSSPSFDSQIMVDDVKEELEPLFDYTRVQPNILFIDDDDDDLVYLRPLAKKTKSSVPDAKGVKDVEQKVKKPAEVIDCDDKIYDLDLFVVEDVSVPEEDPAIRELRLKREELASFAKSADDVLRAVEEAAKKKVASLCSSYEKLPAPVPKPPVPKTPVLKAQVPEPPAPVERNKIVISVQDKDQGKQFRVFVDDEFERFFKMYAEKVKIDRTRLVFCFDGEKIDSSVTPASMDMEDGDMIEVHVK